MKQQNNQFKKIKILTSNFDLEVSPEFTDVFSAQTIEQKNLLGQVETHFKAD